MDFGEKSLPGDKKLPEGIGVHVLQDTTMQCICACAYLFGTRGVKKDPIEALKWFELAAAKGDSTALLNLGVMYFRGEGVPQDRTKAVAYFTDAAEKGNADAQYALGVLHVEKDIPDADRKKAYAFFRQAAEKGHPGGLYNMAMALDRGIDAPRDPERARALCLQAAELGFPPAQVLLAIYYSEDGDMEQAVAWFTQAAHSGEVMAQRSLAQIFASGHGGVGKNYPLAYAYAVLAADADDPVARNVLGSLLRRCTSQDIEAGESILKDLQVKPSSREVSMTVPPFDIRNN